jgi:hypothetical protein
VTVDGTFDTDVDPSFVGTAHAHYTIINGQVILDVGPSIGDFLATGRLEPDERRPMPMGWTALIEEENSRWAIVVTDPVMAMRIALTVDDHLNDILGFSVEDVDMKNAEARGEYLQALSDLFSALNSLHVGIYILQSTGIERGFP